MSTRLNAAQLAELQAVLLQRKADIKQRLEEAHEGKTRAEHARRVKEHGVRVDVSLLDTDGSTYAQEMRGIIETHGDAGKSLRFLLDFYKNNK